MYLINTSCNCNETKADYLNVFQVVFLQSVIRPFVYIGTDTELHKAKQSNQVKKMNYKSFKEKHTL